MGVLATLVEVDATRQDPVGSPLNVDFNPQSLRLTHNATGPAATQGSGASSVETTAVPRQVTGYTTTLSMELLFDTSRDGSDVRAKTLVLVALARPAGTTAGAGRSVRFSWGSFLFTGYIESLGETIDYFSPDGVPLRATVTLSMRGLADRDARPDSGAGFGAGAGFSAGIGASAGVGISAGGAAGASFGAGVSAGASFGAGASFSAGVGASAGVGFSASAGASASGGLQASVGTTPLTFSASGDTVQSLAARSGVSWKAVADANGIDNPRLLPPGTVLDLRIST